MCALLDRYSFSPVVNAISLAARSRTASDCEISLKTRLQLAEDICVDQRARWYSGGSKRRPTCLNKLHHGLGTSWSSMLLCHIKVLQHDIEPTSRNRQTLIDAIQYACSTVEMLASSETLVYWSDGLTVLLSQLGMMILKVR